MIFLQFLVGWKSPFVQIHLGFDTVVVLTFSNLIVQQQNRYCIYVDRNMFGIISQIILYWVAKRKTFFQRDERRYPKGKWTGFQLRSRKSWFKKSSKSQFKKEARQGEKKSKSIEMTTTYILLLQNIRYVYNSMR